jgi:hypothetical protein
MALLVISIPIMILAVGLAVIPLVVVSHREVTDLVREAETKFDRHRRNHPVRHRAPLERHTPATSQQQHWHEPVLLGPG